MTVPEPPGPSKNQGDEKLFGARGKEARYVNKLRKSLSKMSEPDRKLMLSMAQKMARR